MAILKPKKIREMGEKELNEKLAEFKMDISKDKASSEIGGTVKSPGRIKETRKTIARILTIKREKEMKNEKMPSKRGEKKI